MTLNAELFIQQTLDSVAEQDYPNLEYLIIDACSADRTLEIIKRHPAINAKIISEQDNGTSEALNKGFTLSKGKYVWALNADDCLASRHTITQLVDLLERNPSCDFAFGDMIMVNEKGKKIGHRYFHAQYGFEDLLCDRRYLPFAGCLLRKSALEKIGGGFDVTLQYCNDLDFLFRLALYGRMIYFPGDSGIFRLHKRSSTIANLEKTGKETFQIRMKYLQLLPRESKIYCKKNRIKALLHLHAAGVSFHSGYCAEVQYHIKQAFKMDHYLTMRLRPLVLLIFSLFGNSTMENISSKLLQIIHSKWWFFIKSMNFDSNSHRR